MFHLSKLTAFTKPEIKKQVLVIISAGLFLLSASAAFGWYREKNQSNQEINRIAIENQQLQTDLSQTEAELSSISAQLVTLQTEDQYARNEQLQAEIKGIETTYKQAVSAYERILDLQGDTTKTGPLEQKFSLVLSQLSQRKESSASATLASLQKDIQDLQAQLAAAVAPIPDNLPASNAPPASGYSRQTVNTEVGQFVVDILTADLNSTRVQVETASAGDCSNDCPVAALADYVARSGGFAGINGPYFCPAEYPSCAGKTNSFDTLLMNKNKTYFNSDNNVYSNVPAMIFSGSSARLVGRSLEWGRDTGVDAVIASQPMLLSGGNIAFGGDGDPKKGSRGSRSFIGSKDNNVYIGVVRGATVAEVAYVLKTLGLQSALNLDSGGSTAFYVNGKYVAGPGRQTPFGIILVRK
ncbi:MAG: hypothetical protein QG639_755 [Patescibacteria group bacterium]|nr:hypothetical protein [Patescibacteria group bacterium]